MQVAKFINQQATRLSTLLSTPRVPLPCGRGTLVFGGSMQASEMLELRTAALQSEDGDDLRQRRDIAMLRASATVKAHYEACSSNRARFSSGAPRCAACGEDCNSLRPMRFWCTRKAGSIGRGRGSSAAARGCNWQLCFLCANGLDTTSTTVVCCGSCGLEATEAVEAENSSHPHGGSVCRLPPDGRPATPTYEPDGTSRNMDQRRRY